MAQKPELAEANQGYWAALGPYHLEIRRSANHWEYQIISLQEAKILADGERPDPAHCRAEVIAVAKRMAPCLDWDAVQWQPLQTGR